MLQAGCHDGCPTTSLPKYTSFFSSHQHKWQHTLPRKVMCLEMQPLLRPFQAEREAACLSCYLPARARGGGERPCLDMAFKDTCRNHNFLETLHLLELGGCSDKHGLRYIGSIRYAVQLEPRSHCGICGASSGKSTRAQEVPRQLQPGCSLLPPPGLPPGREALFIPTTLLPGR